MSYGALALAFLSVPVLLAVAAAVVVRPPAGWWLRTAAVGVALLLLTAVFDSLMIAADLFRFDEDRLLGVRVGLAPLEDFAWPVAAVLVVPAVALLMSRDEEDDR